MSVDDLGIKERAVLLALMAEAREVSNPELDELAGLRLDGASRRKLNQRRLVDSRRQGRSYAHLLTDDGWAWCAKELTAGRPARAGTAGGALYAVLAGLHRYLERSDRKLADVFRREAATAVSGHSGTPGAPGPSATPELERRVRAAYRSLAREPRGWVSLAQLRPLLGDIAREDLDATLRRMSLTARATLVPRSNQKVLSDREREAAVRIGGEDNHLLSIDAS
jgi:hypothetical protein